MANVVYHAGAKRLFDTETATPDLRMLLIDDAGTYVADPDHDTLTDLSLGSNELSTTNYARQDLAGVAYTHDTVNNRVELNWTSAVFATLGPASAGPSVQAAVTYVHVDGTDANDVPVIYQDTGGFPKQVNGEDFTVTSNSEGMLQAA